MLRDLVRVWDLSVHHLPDLHFLPGCRRLVPWDFRPAVFVGVNLFPVVVVLRVLVPAVFAVDQVEEYLPVADHHRVPDDFAAACPVGLPELFPAVADQMDDFPLSVFAVVAAAVAFCGDHFSRDFAN
jgi:hypothetical protein